MRWQGWRVMVAASMVALPHGVSACRLSLAPGLLADRVAGVSLAFDGVTIESAAMKPGWVLSITNDPSGRVSVTGHAIVGAAFLSGPDLLSMLTFSPEPGVACGDALGDTRRAALTVTLYRGDRLVRTPVRRSDFRLAP